MFVSSLTKQRSFEPKLDWSAVYSGSAEIYSYFNDFADKYRLHQYIKTEHKVVGAKWNEQTSGWDVKVEDVRTGNQIDDHCDVLINAGGVSEIAAFPSVLY